MAQFGSSGLKFALNTGLCLEFLYNVLSASAARIINHYRPLILKLSNGLMMASMNQLVC